MKKNLFTLFAVGSALVAVAQSPRLVLFEEFTGENCPPCASANPGINATLKANASKVVAIKWQVPIPSAPATSWSLYKTNKAEIDWRFRGWNGGTGSSILNPPSANGYGYHSQYNSTYNITSGVNSAPQGRLDGQYLWSFGNASSNHGAQVSAANVINDAANVPSPFTITMAREWGPNGASINLTVTAQASMNYSAVGNLVFRTVMVEREIIFETAPGTNGEKEFHDAAIASFPNLQAGTPLPANWTNGQSHTFTLNCVIPSYARKKTEIAFVGFIQDDGNREVQQAFRLEKEALPFDAAALAPQVESTCSASLSAIVTVSNNGLNPITAMTITPYTDGNAANTTTWVGSIAAGATETVALDAFSAPATGGSHSFSYAITAINGNDLEPANNGNSGKFLVVDEFTADPVVEDFAGNFPPVDWGVMGHTGGIPWSKTNAVSAFNLGTGAAVLPFYTSTTIGDLQELVLPAVNLQGTDEPKLDFVYAYARRVTGSDDKLEVFASKDCGATWTSVFSRSGTSLMSTLDVEGQSWMPEAQDWRSESLALPAFNDASVLIKFVGTSDNGNNLYLDNINLRQSGKVGISENSINGYRADVFPNPTTGKATVNITAPVSGNAEILITNTLGQTISAENTALSAGENTVSIDLSNEATGIYNLSIRTARGTVNKKLTVTH